MIVTAAMVAVTRAAEAAAEAIAEAEVRVKGDSQIFFASSLFCHQCPSRLAITRWRIFHAKFVYFAMALHKPQCLKTGRGAILNWAAALPVGRETAFALVGVIANIYRSAQFNLSLDLLAY